MEKAGIHDKRMCLILEPNKNRLFFFSGRNEYKTLNTEKDNGQEFGSFRAFNIQRLKLFEALRIFQSNFYFKFFSNFLFPSGQIGRAFLDYLSCNQMEFEGW